MTQHTLEQFLSTANADDATALVEAQSHTVTTYRKIGGNEARQIFSMFGVLDDVESNQTNTNVAQIVSGVDTTLGQLCKALIATINSNGQFATDPNENDGLLNRLAADELESVSIITPEAKTALFDASENDSHPFENTTIEQVKAIRNPASWQPVTNVANPQHIVLADGSINGNSATGGFRLTAIPAETFSGTVKLRVLAKRAEDTEYTPFDFIEINMRGQFAAGVPKPVPYQRTALLKGFKHFKFEYLEPYAGALTEVTAEGI